MRKSTRKIISFVTALVFTFSQTPYFSKVSDAVASSDGTVYTENMFDFQFLDDDTIIILKYNSTSDSTIVIPDYLGGRKVTHIGADAFSNNTAVTEVKMPDSITHIEENAFSGCTNLNKVTFSEALVEIGSHAFSNCGFKNIILPDSIEKIGSFAFAECRNLEYADFGKGLMVLGDDVFDNDELMNLIVLPENITSCGHISGQGINVVIENPDFSANNINADDSAVFIWKTGDVRTDNTSEEPSYSTENGFRYVDFTDDAFNAEFFQYYIDNDKVYITGYNKSVLGDIDKICLSIPATINGFKVVSFELEEGSDRYDLLYISLPSTIEKIESGKLERCLNLKSLRLSEGLKSIGNNVFNQCISLVSVSIPDTVTEMGKYVFSECRSLLDIKIGKGILSVNEGTFRSCSELTYLVFPENVMYIGNRIAEGTSNLKEIDIYNPDCKTEKESFVSAGKSYSDGGIYGNSLEIYGIRGGLLETCCNISDLNYKSETKEYNTEYTENYEYYYYSPLKNSQSSGMMSGLKCSYTEGGIIVNKIPQDTVHVKIPSYINGRPVIAVRDCSSPVAESIEFPETLIDVSCIFTSNEYHDEETGNVSYGNSKIKKINIPSGVMSVDIRNIRCAFPLLEEVEIENQECCINFENYNFDFCYTDCETGTSVYPPALKVYGYGGGAAEYSFRYASEKLYNFSKSAFEFIDRNESSDFKIGKADLNYLTEYSEELGFYAVVSGINFDYVTEKYNKYRHDMMNYSSHTVELEIPDEICGIPVYSVEGIGQNSLFEFSTITMGDHILSISDEAFSNVGFWDIKLPDKLNYIGKNAFRGCKFESIVIPDNVSIIDDFAFADNSDLRHIDLGHGIKRIGNNVFFNDSKINVVVLPESLDLAGSLSGKMSYIFENPDTLQNFMVDDNISSDYYSHPEGIIFGYENSTAEIFFGQFSHVNSQVGFSYSENYDYSNGESTVTITGFNCNTDSYPVCLVIPETIEGKKVTAIGSNAFEGKKLGYLSLPSSVERIESNAFGGCSSLECVRFSEGLEFIGQGAFAGCTSLLSAELPHSLRYMENGAFENCVSLRKIVFGAGITTIPGRCFLNCLSLNNINLPSNIQRIEDYAFGSSKFDGCGNMGNGTYDYDSFYGHGEYYYYQNSYEKAATIPKKLCFENPELTLSDYALKYAEDISFYGPEICRVREEYSDRYKFYCPVFPSIIEYRYADGMYYAGSFEEQITGEIEITKLRSSLRNLRIPSSVDGKPVVSIGSMAIYGRNAVSVRLPESVCHMDDRALERCNGLIYVDIPESVKYLKGRAFSTNNSLRSVYVENRDFIICDMSGDYYNNLPNILFIGGSGGAFEKQAYEYGLRFYNRENLGEKKISADYRFNYEVAEDENGEIYAVVTGLNKSGYYDSYGNWIQSYSDEFVESVVIPSEIDGLPVHEIADFAFRDTRNVLSFTVSEGIEKIGEGAFMNCGGTYSVKLPDSLKYIGENAFEHSQYLCSIIASDSSNLEYVGQNCFYGTSYIEKFNGAVYIGKTVVGYRYIDSINMYPGYYERENLTIRPGTVKILDGAFRNCDIIRTVTIPESIDHIGNNVFEGCINLEFVNLPESINYVGNETFSGCTSMSSIRFPSGIKYVGDSTFENCTSLERVVFSRSADMTSIGIRTFAGCTSLSEITLPEKLFNIGKDTFRDSYIWNEAGDLVTISDDTWGIIAVDCKSLNPVVKADYSGTIHAVGTWNIDEITILQSGCCSPVFEFGSSFRNENENMVVYGYSGSMYEQIALELGYQFSPIDLYITKQPENSSGRRGVKAEFSIEATGRDLTYEWYYMTDGDSRVISLGSEYNSSFVSIDTSDIKTNMSVYCVITDRYGMKQQSGTAFYDITTEISEDGFEYEKHESGGITIVSCSQNSETIEIPETINGGTVVCIESNAFKNCIQLENVIIPDTVSCIKPHAFDGTRLYENQSGLRYADDWLVSCDTDQTEVTVRRNLKGIADGAFEGCSQLVSVDMPLTLDYIGCDAFRGCSSLTSLSVPYGVEYLESGTIAGCSSLKTLSISETVFCISETLTDVIPDDLCIRSKNSNWFAEQNNIKFEEPCSIINSHPEPTQVYRGEDVHFRIGTSGDNVDYQWQYCIHEYAGYSDWININNENEDQSELIVSSDCYTDHHLFRCLVRDENGDIFISYDASFMTIENLSISKQPEDCYTYVDESASFSVSANGENLSYSWQCSNNGTDWTDTLSSFETITFNNVSLDMDGLMYRCVITDGYGKEITTNKVQLRIKTPYFTEQLQDVYVYDGETFCFKNVASGDGLIYQWQYSAEGANWIDMGEASPESDIMFQTISYAWNGYRYRCKVTDSSGKTVISNSAVINVAQLSVSEHPQSAEVYEGDGVSFTVKASGERLKYKWQYSTDGKTWYDADFDGSTTDTLKISSTDYLMNDTKYRCIISDGYKNTVTSSEAVLSIVKAAVIKHPENTVVYAGNGTSFTVISNAAEPIYQWQYSIDGDVWSDVYGGQSETLVIENAAADMNGFQYRCIITDRYGRTVTSNTAELTVRVLEVVIQPEDKIVYAGDSAMFSVLANGVGVTYQWQSSVDGEIWENVSSDYYYPWKLNIRSVNKKMNGMKYRCVITDRYGESVESRISELTVRELYISNQPDSIIAYAGEEAWFETYAVGEEVSYQWQYFSETTGYEWKDIGSDNKKLSIEKVSADMNGTQFRCVVTDKYGRSSTCTAAGMTVRELYFSEPLKSISIYDGDIAEFEVKAVGEGVAYQWQYSSDGIKWRNIGAASESDFMFMKLYASWNGYWCRCVITDKYGKSVTGDKAEMRVLTERLEIVNQPEDYIGIVGETALFQVETTGEGMTYQWQSSLNKGISWSTSGLEGNKTSRLTVPIIKARIGAYYRCVITDEYGRVIISQSAELKERKALSIKEEPSDYIGKTGETGYFEVKAEGDGLKYQWQSSLNKGMSWSTSGLEGNKTSRLTVPIIKARIGAYYRCVITDEYGRVIISQSAELKDRKALSIKEEPSDYIGKTGETGYFEVKAEGDGLKYQWQSSLNKGISWSTSGLEGNKTSRLTVPIIKARIGAYYRCVVTDAYGTVVISQSAELKEKVNVELKINENPSDYTGKIGGTGYFEVKAEGNGLIYQWQSSLNKGMSWSTSGLEGNKTSRLTVPIIKARIGAYYRCVVTDADGTEKISSSAELKLKQELKINGQSDDFYGQIGEPIELSVSAEGDGLNYQWEYSFNKQTWTKSSLTGNKTNKISTVMIPARDGAYFRCRITDVYGKEVISEPIQVNVKISLSIKKQPQDYTGKPGDTAEFRVSAAGDELKYTWQYYNPGTGIWKNYSTIDDGTEYLKVEITEEISEMMFRCVIVDNYGCIAVSETAKITVD